METISKLNVNEFNEIINSKLNYNSINDITNNKDVIIKPEKNIGGVYIFWWKAKTDHFIDKHYYLIPKSSYKNKVKIEFNKDWIDKSTYNKKLCLYVGKTTNIQQRLRNHLKLTNKNIWNDTLISSGKKPNTVSQLRIGLERLFNDGNNINQLEKIKENIEITYFVINDYENSVNRFYLEDYFVGNFFPLFNVDIER